VLALLAGLFLTVRACQEVWYIYQGLLGILELILAMPSMA
jgi:hypothetical protein